MRVFEIMTRDLLTVTPETTLAEAARLMWNNGSEPLPVCEGDWLLGMVTYRDITVRATAEGLDPDSTLVCQLMVLEVICCFEGDDVGQAAAIMQRAQLQRLPVVNREGRLVGVVSLGDIARQTGDESLAGKTRKRVSQPSREH
jgi:CBS domain-containing protein